MPQPQTETNMSQRLRSNAATARNIANRANDCANDYSRGHAVGGTRLADDCLEAADEIDRLRKELTKVQAARAASLASRSPPC